MTLPSLYDLTLDELTVWLAEQGEPPYRAQQIFHALYQQKISCVEEMTTLSQSLREKLSAQFLLQTIAPVQEQKSSDGTMKWLAQLSDKDSIETVLIPMRDRRTVCVSTQVGCAYACTFCASGMLGFRRNLTSGEIVQQILLVENSLSARPARPERAPRTVSRVSHDRPTGERVTNVVFMGMGEPLANYDNLLKAIRILNAPEGLHLGARKITVSTVGLVPMIERLSAEGLQIELSISLHAPNDELRAKLMPVNKKYSLAQLISVCRAYVEATNRLITFEYILIHEVNDGMEQAAELVELLKGLKSKVNLIPFHPIPGTPWTRPPMERMLAFEHFLRDRHVPCTLRRSRGLDIEGACGQLRLQHT